MMKPARSLLTEVLRSLETGIAIMALSMIVLSLALWWGGATAVVSNLPLWGALALGGGPLVWQLLTKLVRREFGSDLLAGISIVVSIILGEYLAGTLVVLMLSGGAALEAYAVRSASSVVQALARRMPTTAHRKVGLNIEDIPLEQIQIGDSLVVFPHEAAPVDGIVLEGHGVMDESYLTGEPFMMSKTPGSAILSGAVNGETALVIQTEALPIDSRYAKIMRVIQSAEGERPRMRRLGDQLGAWYTPLALAIAALAWIVSGEAVRFLAVLVVATPCPLLIAIPVTVIGSISLAAKRAIIVRDPAALEAADTCRTIIFDKTGTLTYGKPQLIEVVPAAGIDPHELLVLVSNLERYSKHPLADAIVTAGREARGAVLEVKEISERPGAGMQGLVAGRKMEITSRKKLLASSPDNAAVLPEQVGGLECLVLMDGRYAGAFRFRDAPRGEGAPFVKHLGPRHQFERVMIVSGDRESEVRYLAEQVGISEVYANQSPEQKLEIVKRETERAGTIFVGDGINDAPALMVATVGIAFGQNSDITSESGDVVVLDSSLQKVDEFLHISRRMRAIALQSAVGGMLLSILAMGFAFAGYIQPVTGALIQEVIDVFAVLNALRISLPPKSLFDYDH